MYFRLYLILFFLYANNSYSQLKEDIKGTWVCIAVKSASGFPIENESAVFHFGDSTVELNNFRYTDGSSPYFNVNYKLKDSILEIRTLGSIFFWKVKSLTGKELSVTKNGKQYFFRKVIGRLPDQHVSTPLFRGNLKSSLEKAIDVLPCGEKSTGYLISLLIRKDGTIDSITRQWEGDDSLFLAIKTGLLSNARHWRPGTLNNKRATLPVKLSIYKMSSLARQLRAKNPEVLIKEIYKRAASYDALGDGKLALTLYEECVNLYKFIVSTQRYSVNPNFSTINAIEKDWINAVMNIAAIHFENGRIEEACKSWATVVGKSPQAMEFINKYSEKANN